MCQSGSYCKWLLYCTSNKIYRIATNEIYTHGEDQGLNIFSSELYWLSESSMIRIVD